MRPTLNFVNKRGGAFKNISCKNLIAHSNEGSLLHFYGELIGPGGFLESQEHCCPSRTYPLAFSFFLCSSELAA